MTEFVRIEETDTEGVAIMRLERPKVNALNAQVGTELLSVANELSARDDVRAVVVWGGPKIFAAGADIAEFPTTGDRDPSDQVDDLIAATFAIENMSAITISAVNGYALGGGCELAMAADFRIAGEGAVFGQPEILLGIIPGAGGTQRLPRLVGITKAKELNYTGRMVKADEALEIGLVSEVVADEAVLERSIELAGTYAKGPASLAQVKRAMMDGMHVSLEEAMKIEKREFVSAFQTDDAVIGIGSFLENGPGKADFTGS